jgi:transposase InsO family protein
MDFLVVPTINFRLLFVLVILRHERRRLISLSVTDHPTAEWIARRITEAFPWNSAPTYLIRDRDAAYGNAVSKRLAAMGIRDHPIAPRSPWQNGHAERLIGSIRRECLDHIVVLGEAHLRRILQAYAALSLLKSPSGQGAGSLPLTIVDDELSAAIGHHARLHGRRARQSQTERPCAANPCVQVKSPRTVQAARRS